MYMYYYAVGWPALAFFIIVIFISYMMLSRLYIAVFLSYFREELRKKSTQQQIRENNLRLETLRHRIRQRSNKGENCPLDHDAEAECCPQP